MTTPQKFFEKMFNENDKITPFYSQIDFTDHSEAEKKFLNKLSIITKYKSYIKNFLISYRVKDHEKKTYIEAYKTALSYNESLDYNRVNDDLETNFVNTMYLMGYFVMFGYLFLLIKKPTNTPMGKEVSILLMSTLFGGYGYYRYKKIDYRRTLDNLYDTLSTRLNRYPEFRYTVQNDNVFNEENFEREDL
jgi:hypothetical protein